jgi:hypothetical protein
LSALYKNNAQGYDYLRNYIPDLLSYQNYNNTASDGFQDIVVSTETRENNAIVSPKLHVTSCIFTTDNPFIMIIL